MQGFIRNSGCGWQMEHHLGFCSHRRKAADSRRIRQLRTGRMRSTGTSPTPCSCSAHLRAGWIDVHVPWTHFRAIITFSGTSKYVYYCISLLAKPFFFLYKDKHPCVHPVHCFSMNPVIPRSSGQLYFNSKIMLGQPDRLQLLSSNNLQVGY